MQLSVANDQQVMMAVAAVELAYLFDGNKGGNNMLHLPSRTVLSSIELKVTYERPPFLEATDTELCVCFFCFVYTITALLVWLFTCI